MEEGLPRFFEFSWKEYTHYAHFRANKAEILKESLLQASEAFSFDTYCRCFVLKHHPLSSVGSRISHRGGRFNIGALDPLKFPSFPCLYLGENDETAFREKFQAGASNPFESITDGALQSKESYGFSKVRGALETVLDITKDQNLKPFLKQIKKLAPSEELFTEAKKLGLNPPSSITTMSLLKTSLTDPNWASQPTALDIPANSQVFGMFAKAAGIQGIIYKSKFESGRCLAIFPDNLKDTTSYIECCDDVHNPKRLDASNFADLS